MHIPILFGLIGGLIHFLFFLFVGKPYPSFLTALVLPLVLSAGLLYAAVRNTRKINLGRLAFREGFFMGMNVSTVMAISSGALLWFYFAEMAPDEAWWTAKANGWAREDFLANQGKLVLGWAFNGFLTTFMLSLPFAALWAWLLRSRKTVR